MRCFVVGSVHVARSIQEDRLSVHEPRQAGANTCSHNGILRGCIEYTEVRSRRSGPDYYCASVIH